MLDEVPSLRSNSTRIPLAFVAVYLCWGSTYTAIRIAGDHLPVPVISATRCLVSTALLAAIALLSGKSLRVPKGEAWKLAVVGLLFMSANNMLLTWSETMVPSGFASLLIATVPIMVAMIEAGLTLVPAARGEPLSFHGWLGTLLAMLGIGVLVWPALHQANAEYRRPALGVAVLLGAGLSFAVGSVLSRRFQFRADTFVATGWQIGVAGIFNTALATATGSFRHTRWEWHGALAVLYLAVVGSLIGLVSFTYLLKHVAVTKVATYAFVNPVIAVLLGIALLHERLVLTELLGMVVVVAGVAMVVLTRSVAAREETLAETAT